MLDDGRMNIQVYAKRSLGEDDMVGELNVPVDALALLGDDNSKSIEQPLFKKEKNNEMRKTGGSIRLTLLRTSDDPGSTQLDSLVGDADDTASIMNTKGKKKQVFGTLLSGASEGVKKIQGSYNVCKPLLQNITIFVKIVDDISEVHRRLTCSLGFGTSEYGYRYDYSSK